VLSENQLLGLCRLKPDAATSASESLDDLREAERLARANWLTATSVEARARVAALVTWGLGRLPRWFVTSLPFGYEGPQIDHRGTVNRDDVIRATAQLVGLVHPNCRAEAVAVQASKAVADAVDLHFLENTRYDAWRSGMPNGSGWCDAVTVTEYGLSRVRCPVEADDETTPEPLIESLPTEQPGSATAPTHSLPSTPPPSCDSEFTEHGAPQEDPHDTRKAIWAGKPIYLGTDTQVSRLFWLLAKPVGRACSLAEVQRAIDVFETDSDRPSDEVRKAGQRVRKAFSKLRERLREAGLDDHVLILREGEQSNPEYSMVWRFTH